MKKLIFAVLALLCTASLQAQQFDVLDQVRADWRKASGMEGPHRFDYGPLSPAPKGYKPFYISHYGRHGSRYAWNSDTYSLLYKVFSDAHNAGALTEAGENFYAEYKDFYEIPYINTGDLVPLGFEQHGKLGKFVYESFPQVFRGAKKVDAVVSTSARSIVSMSSFCLSLKGCNPDLDIFQSSNHTGMLVAAPTGAPRQVRRFYEGQNTTPDVESVSHFNSRTVDYDGILGNLFKDPEFVSSYDGGKAGVLGEFFALLGGYRNYSEEAIFDGYLTEDQMLGLWEASNYSSYVTDLTARYGNIPLLEDIIAKTDAALDDPTMAANLRFGHDYVAEAFLCLINANGCGTVVEEASDAKYWFQNYNIPMATTILFVFYRNRKDDVLFKLVWNEEEASLPQLTPVTGCYYRWNDFKEWADGLIAAHPQIEAPKDR